MWTNTCCSHPLAVPDEKEVADGMGAKRAAQRRIKSELGVEPDECPVEHIEYLTRILYRAPSSGGRWQEHEVRESTTRLCGCRIKYVLYLVL